jgi:hypothetical protein
MGKSQKKRAMRRHNPMRVPDSHLPKGLTAASSSSNKTEAVLPIIKKVEPLLFFFLLHLSPLISRTLLCTYGYVISADICFILDGERRPRRAQVGLRRSVKLDL